MKSEADDGRRILVQIFGGEKYYLSAFKLNDGGWSFLPTDPRENDPREGDPQRRRERAAVEVICRALSKATQINQ